MDVYAIHAASLAALESEQGGDCPVFTWQGQDYPALVNSKSGGKPLGFGGFVPDANLRLTVLSAQFSPGATPQLKQQIQFEGEVYRINEINTMPNGFQIELVCSLFRSGS